MRSGVFKRFKPRLAPGQVHGYVLSGPLEPYLTHRYGQHWQLSAAVDLENTTPPLLMNEFRPGVGCCTITALTSVFRHIQVQTADRQIPAANISLFDQIEATAARYGYHLKRGRTNPLLIGAIVRNLYRQFQLTGRAGSTILWPAACIRRELDAGYPVLLNIACGHYRHHTVTVVGYQLWQDITRQPPERQRWIWQVHDGWSAEARYIDHWALTRPWSGQCSVFSVTRIRPFLRSCP